MKSRFEGAAALAIMLVLSAVAVLPLSAQHPQKMTPAELGNVRNYLTTFLEPPKGLSAEETRVSLQLIIGPGTTQTIIVYVSGWIWCGSGGCQLFMLRPKDSGFRVLGHSTIVQLPVRLLPTSSHGRPDIGVMVCGGGILNCYESALSFNGKKYPLNPSMPPARKLQHPQGKIIIGQNARFEGPLLYGPAEQRGHKGAGKDPPTRAASGQRRE